MRLCFPKVLSLKDGYRMLETILSNEEHVLSLFEFALINIHVKELYFFSFQVFGSVAHWP